MKAMKLFFLYCLFKVVVGLPDFRNLPRFDTLLRQSLSDRYVCSNVTSFACISPLKNRGILKNNYSTIAQSFIRRNAINILKMHLEFDEKFSSLPEEVSVERNIHLDKETTWFSACVGRAPFAKNSLHTLKKTMEQAGSLQDIVNSEDSESWENVAKVYANNFGFSPFFEVVLYDDNVLAIRRPYSMKIKSHSHNALHSLIETFFFEFANGMFTEIVESAIKNRLFGIVTTFLRYIKGAATDFQFINVENFAEAFDDATNNVFDLVGHFEDIGLKINDYDLFYFDKNYFENLGLFLVTLSNGEIANLIHFMYAMNSRVFSTWYSHESVNKYTEEECFSHMPFKSGVVKQIVNDHLASKLTLMDKMLTNIIDEYKKEIDNSWLNDDKKEMFLPPLEELKVKIAYLELSTPYQIDTNFPVQMNGLQNIVNFEKTQLKFKVSSYKIARKENIRVSRNEKDGEHLVPYVNYNVRYNLLEIPLEELLLPLFGSELTIAWNYAYFGVAISRELFKLHNNFYFTIAKYSQHLISKIDCFKMLQYPVRERVNFDNLINSCVGLKIAYKAFEKEIKLNEHNRSKISRLLDITRKKQSKKAKQQFFIAYSAIYCEETEAETVGICVSNMESFAKAFKCEADSPMNPPRRCDFWSKPE